MYHSTQAFDVIWLCDNRFLSVWICNSFIFQEMRILSTKVIFIEKSTVYKKMALLRYHPSLYAKTLNRLVLLDAQVFSLTIRTLIRLSMNVNFNAIVYNKGLVSSLSGLNPHRLCC